MRAVGRSRVYFVLDLEQEDLAALDTFNFHFLLLSILKI
jgi:hypothetical protein